MSRTNGICTTMTSTLFSARTLEHESTQDTNQDTNHDTERLAELRRQAGEDLLRPSWALLEADGRAYESEVVGGAPEHLLVEAAENYGCDAIVMGAGASGLGERVLGSVSLDLVRAAPVPVTVVRAAH